MLEKLKIWIYKNYFITSAILLTTLFFYLSLNNYYFYQFFLLTLLFFNYYYLRGLEILFNTFLYPLPLFLLPSIFDLKNYIILITWPIYYFIFLKNKKLGWSIFLFISFLIISVYFEKVNFIYLIILSLFLILTVSLFGFSKNLLNSVLISIFISEAIWLFYFLPFNYILRTILIFILFIWILNKELI